MYINRNVFYMAYMKIIHLVAHHLTSACNRGIWHPEKSEQGAVG